MDRRKIQRVGGGTYTVSLPKAWAQRANLDAGSVVTIAARDDDRLVIESAAAADRLDSVRFRIDDEDEAWLERTIRAAYAAGCEEIRLDGAGAFTRTQRRAVERVADALVGLTVEEATETRLVLRTLVGPEEVSVRQSVRQLRYTALSAHREAAAALDGGRAGGERDGEATRVDALIGRHVVRGLSRLDEADALGLSRPALFELRTTARALCRVVTHAGTVRRVAAVREVPPDHDVAEALGTVAGEAESAVETATDAVVGDPSAAAAHEALDARDRARSTAERLNAELGADDGHLGRALDALCRTAAAGGEIAEAALERSLREEDRPAAEAVVGEDD